MDPLLTISDLKIRLTTPKGAIYPVRGVSLSLLPRETLGVVGESGCGKSMLASAILRLLPRKLADVQGSIVLNGTDILSLGKEGLREIRGKEIAMIFQEPMAALNPLMSIGDQIAESVRHHQRCSRAKAKEQALELLSMVRIPDGEGRYRALPHEISGGMRQRVMIAIALACKPKILIADEPTTALDVTVQAQILELLNDLSDMFQMSVILISHDLGVIAERADRVIVMYMGRIVEEASVTDLFDNARHPYTLGLIASRPDMTPDWQPRSKLFSIAGAVPGPKEKINGCEFSPRCPMAADRCRQSAPPLAEVGAGHKAACWRHEEIKGNIYAG